MLLCTPHKSQLKLDLSVPTADNHPFNLLIPQYLGVSPATTVEISKGLFVISSNFLRERAIASVNKTAIMFIIFSF